MKLSFLSFWAVVLAPTDAGEAGLRRDDQVLVEEEDLELDLPTLDGEDLEGRRLADDDDDDSRKNRRKKRRKKRNDDDDDDDSGGGDGGSVSSRGFRLEMRCYDRYQWSDESIRCMDHCPTARGCYSGADVRIRKCGTKDRYQDWVKKGSSLCLARCSEYCLHDGRLKDGRSAAIMKRGSKSLGWDSVSGSWFRRRAYEIQSGGRCLTPHHEPMPGEPVKFQPCSKARQHDTNAWEVN